MAGHGARVPVAGRGGVKRREFLKLAGGFTLAQGVSGRVAADGAAGQPLFVVVFLRGGADGLHLVAPSADPLYVAARPADLRVLDSGDKAGGLLANSLQPDLGFRLHPGLGALLPLYQSGHLGIVHAAGLENATRSHFVAQDMMERGVAADKGLVESTGWLARSLLPSREALAAYSTTSNPVFGLKGVPGYLAAPDLAGRPRLSLWRCYPATAGAMGGAGKRVQQGHSERLAGDRTGFVCRTKRGEWQGLALCADGLDLLQPRW